MIGSDKRQKERIRRVQVLLRELGYSVHPGTDEDGLYSGYFESAKGFQAVYSIDRECRFLELVFTFDFSESLGSFLTNKIEEVLRICYETGCYVHFERVESGIAFTVFAKLYYTGLNYLALKDSLVDFKDCVFSLRELLDVEGEGGR